MENGWFRWKAIPIQREAVKGTAFTVSACRPIPSTGFPLSSGGKRYEQGLYLRKHYPAACNSICFNSLHDFQGQEYIRNRAHAAQADGTAGGLSLSGP